MGKTYLAIVHQVMELDEDVIDMPLGPASGDQGQVPGAGYALL